MRFIKHAVVLAATGACAVTLTASVVPPALAAVGTRYPVTTAGAARLPETGTTATTLLTGERVLTSPVGGRRVVGIQPTTPLGPAGASAGAPSGASTTRARTMTVGDHAYVVPDLAAPYLGRQLDLSLFDVTQPPQRVEIRSVGPARTVAGLTPVSISGNAITAQVDSPAAFAAALRSPDPLPGVASIRAANSPPASADPQYPMATLTVKGLDRNGRRTVSGSVAVDNVDDLRRYANMQAFAANGTATFSVPVGTYSIAVEIGTLDEDNNIVADSLVLFPELTVTAPATEVQADARTATSRVPVPTTPRPATVEQTTLTFGRTCAAGLQASLSFMATGAQPEMYVTPTAPVRLGSVHWYTYFRLNGPIDDLPYVYDLQFPVDGAVPETIDTTVSEAGLATVDARYHSDVPDHRIATYRASVEPWELVPMRFSSTAVAPMRRTEYVSAPPEVLWASGVVWHPSENNGVDVGPWSLLARGEVRDETHLAAPLVPGADASTTGSVPCPACRQGSTLSVNLSPWTDTGGRVVSGLSASETLTVSNTARLYSGETSLLEMREPTGKATIPTPEADLRLELDTTKSAPWTTTATRVRTVWRWHSAIVNPASSEGLPPQRGCPDGGRDCRFEPLLFLSYQAGVNQSNAIPAGIATSIGIQARHQLYDPAPVADRLTVDVSTDDGATWTPIDVRAVGDGRFTATVTPAAGSRFLSLRVHASDPTGDTVDQTVTNAVRVVD